MIPLEFKFRIDKQLALDFPGAEAALRRMSRIAQQLLRRRIERDGKLADGKPLPEVSSAPLFVPTDHPIVARLGPGQLRGIGKAGSRKMTYLYGAYPEKGGDDAWPEGYRSVKERLTGRSHVGASLTGSMWDSLRATARQRRRGRRGDDWEIRLYFAGTDKRQGVRQRAKARLLQYRKRGDGAFGKRNALGQATAAKEPEFYMMELAPDELRILRKVWMRELRLFKPR